MLATKMWLVALLGEPINRLEISLLIGECVAPSKTNGVIDPKFEAK